MAKHMTTAYCAQVVQYDGFEMSPDGRLKLWVPELLQYHWCDCSGTYWVDGWVELVEVRTKGGRLKDRFVRELVDHPAMTGKPGARQCDLFPQGAPS